MTDPVTVAIPVRDGGPLLAEVLAAVRAQELDRACELLVVDSGSRDGSVEVAREHGATVIEIPPAQFSHGGVRNLLMERSAGAHVAFLTQDAVPVDERWLARLLGAFELADDVALAFGPYVPRVDASHMVARELTAFFAGFAPDGRPRIDRLAPGQPSPRGRPGPVGFFTDANGCVARWAWRSVPFPPVPYAEDHALALAMLEAGQAKVFVPDAAVRHSHDYPPAAYFRRCFDEWRGLREVYGYRQPIAPRFVLATIRGEVGADRRWLRARGLRGAGLAAPLARSALHYAVRAAGAGLGSRADRLPPRARRACSLERRAGFEPLTAARG